MGLYSRTDPGPIVKAAPLVLVGLGLSAVLFSVVSPLPERLIWNRTGSVAQGLYWLSDEPFTKGGWVVVSARSAEAQWAELHGFVGEDWPLLKRVAGVPGDEICRDGVTVLINGMPAGEALIASGNGVVLPSWNGCRRIEDGEIFLMNAHPQSLDGRYFGISSTRDIEGSAILLLRAP
jgi:conjugative transfer signal peptidase TraF